MKIVFSTLLIGLIGVFTPIMSIVPGGKPSPIMPPHAERETITGVYVEIVRDETWNFLRFYADSTVIAAGIAMGENDLCTAWLNIDKWFHKDNPDFPAGIGTYQLEGSTVTLTVTHSQGDVDYTGETTPKGLRLDIHSHINGFQDTNRYYQPLATLCE